MTRDEIIRMAREAGIIPSPGSQAMLDRFAHLIAAAEREACCAIAKFNQANHLEHLTADQIKARGETK